MNIIDLLIGKTTLVKTNMEIEVPLVIKSIESKHHTTQITSDTPENDWWGQTETTHWYLVTFENGASKKYDSLEQIKILN